MRRPAAISAALRRKPRASDAPGVMRYADVAHNVRATATVPPEYRLDPTVLAARV